MSDIKKLLLRLPISVYELIEAESVRLKTSVNQLIVDRLSDNRGEVPKRFESLERTRSIASKLPNTFAGSDIPVPPPKAACRECGSLSTHQRWCKSNGNVAG